MVWRKWAEGTAKTAGVVYCFHKWVGWFTFTKGDSMKPTLHGGEILFACHPPVALGKLSVGDLVVYRVPVESERMYGLKRVMGLGGDEVFVKGRSKHEEDRWEIVPQGRVWLQGDNVDASRDSRAFGAVPIRLVESKVVFQVAPFAGAGRIPRGIPDSLAHVRPDLVPPPPAAGW